MSCKSCEKQYNYEAEVCPALGVQDVVVGVPVEIKPFAKVGRVKTECMGKPIIKRGTKECEGKPRCTCKFTVSQKIRVEVPMVFGAKTEIGEAGINCKNCLFEEESQRPIKPARESAEEEYYTGIIG